MIAPLLLALGLPSLLPAQTLLDDTFADGSRTNQNLPTSAAWYLRGNATSLAASPGQMTYTSNGNVSNIVGYFTGSGTPYTLSVGETMTLSMSLSLSNVPDIDNVFRFGLFNSGGSQINSDSTNFLSSSFNAYDGYSVWFNPSATSAAYTIRDRIGTNDAIFSSSSSVNSVLGATTNASIDIPANTLVSLAVNLSRFPVCREGNPRLPIWCVTPHEGRVIHRFFDTCPISPSGRYLALFRLPFEDRLNQPGEEGGVVLVDLESGTEQTVATTRGWEPQMGANLNWGADDHCLVFNDVDPTTWQPLLVKLDPLRGTREVTVGGVYHVSPDGRYAAAASTDKMARTQYGYGVRLPEDRVGRNVGFSENDGLFITDLQTGIRRLAFSLADACRHLTDLDDPDNWEIYGFHAKWSPTGTHLIFTIRSFPARGSQRFHLISSKDPQQQLRYDVLTLRPDGTDIHNAVPAERWRDGGHHINWFPDGEALSMNLGGFGDGLRFVRVGRDGTDLRPLLAGVPGSGHPTIHADGTHLLTDAYAGEPVASGDGTVPLRWIDLQSGQETRLASIGARVPGVSDSVLRVDPHPAWDRTGRYVIFNGVAFGDNTRRVFLADVSPMFEALNSAIPFARATQSKRH